MITRDCVLRKGAQSNWRGKQARICVLCDAFCPTHSAATSQRHAPAPRQRCIFLKTNSHSDSRRPASERAQAVKGRRGESSSAQTYYAHTLLPHLRPPVHRRGERKQRVGRGTGNAAGNKGHALISTTSLPAPATSYEQEMTQKKRQKKQKD